MKELTIQQQTAMQIANSGNKISTPEQLAELRLARLDNGNFAYPRYKDGSDTQRLSWLNRQLLGLALIAHQTVDPTSIKIDLLTLDNGIMENTNLRELTLPEIQEAFRKGVNREYGDYYGLTSPSLFGFLTGFLKSEKKQAATAIIHHREIKEQQEKDARFFRELYEAKQKGLIDLPDFHGALDDAGPARKKTYSAEELAAHRERVRQQAEEILKNDK